MYVIGGVQVGGTDSVMGLPMALTKRLMEEVLWFNLDYPTFFASYVSPKANVPYT